MESTIESSPVHFDSWSILCWLLSFNKFPRAMVFVQLWERQRGENSKAFSNFALYRDLGAGRSLARLADSGAASVSLRRLEACSARWNWVARAEAYDDELDTRRRRTNETKRDEMNERQAKLGLLFQNVVLSKVNTWIGEDGKMRVILTPSETARLPRDGRQSGTPGAR